MSRLDKLAKGPWLGLLAAFALFLLNRPYPGIRHDGRLYVADALAKLDPAGVGRDIIFLHDGQFGFSLYTPLLARLIAAVGLSNATVAVVLVTLILWFAALAWLVAALLADKPPAVRWAALLLAAALPSLYGPLNIIGFGEPYATPRGLAEAAGMAGMALYLSDRRLAGLAACVAGMLFHPIMGLCSAAAIGLALCLEDRRWLWAGLAGIAAVTVAGLLHLPLADRMVTVMDPVWRAVIAVRSPILLPSLWPIESWSLLAVQACTLAAATLSLSAAPRRLALAALIAGLVGVAVTWLLGERLSLLLFLQVQAWRMLEPMAVLSLAGLAVLCFDLPRRGPCGLLGLAFLAMAWMVRDVTNLGLILAPIGLLFALVGERMTFSRPRLFSVIAVGLLVAAAAGYGALRGVALVHLLARLPEGWPSLGYFASSDLLAMVVALAIGVWLAKGGTVPRVEVRIAGTVALGLLALLLWDDRSDYVRHRDEGRDPALIAMTAERPGEVLWLAGDTEPWLLMGRPNWAARIQGAGVVFSRPLALEVRDRAHRLQQAGLASPDFLRLAVQADERMPPPDPAQVRRFCAAPDAPAWIVWPRWRDAPPLARELDARDWSPKASFVAEQILKPAQAPRADRYAVIPCAGA